jgi:murein hydrolase activator
MRRILPAALLLVFIPLLAAASPRAELQGIRKEIQQKELLIRKTSKIETKVSGELAEMEKSLREKEARLRTLNRDLDLAENRLRAITVEVERVKAEAERKKLEIQHRLASMYKGGETGSMRVFFSSDSLPQMAESYRYMNSVLRQDHRLVEEYNARIDTLKELKVKLERETLQKEKIKESIAEKKGEIESEKAKKATYLSKVKSEKKGYIVSLRELEANARRLQSMVERLEAAARKGYTPKAEKGSPGKKPERTTLTYSGKGLGSRKGDLGLPVRGQIVDRFGRHKHPEFNSFTFSNGIAIAAPLGADIHSIADGRIIYADYFKGYGNMVIVDHGEGYFSLYAHASKLHKKEGASVGKNEVIASVGDVDSAKGPIVYFEIRYQGKPVDPAPWFK